MAETTIIIPTFNSEEYIVDLLNTLLQLDNVEIIVVDDGSTDLTVAKIKENFFDRIHLVLQNHVGPGNARNLGIFYATGTYLMFIDSDDSIDVPVLSKILKNLPKSFDIISFTKYNVIDSFLDDNQRKGLCIDILENNYSVGFIPGPVSKIYNTNFLKTHNLAFPKSLKIGEDKLFNLNAVLKSKEISIVNNSFYGYRFNPNSLTKKYKEGTINQQINLLKQIKLFIMENDIPCAFRKIALKYWINDANYAVSSGANKIELDKYRNYILTEFTLKEIINEKLPLKKRVVLSLLLIRGYSFLKLIKNTLKRVSPDKNEKTEVTKI